MWRGMLRIVAVSGALATLSATAELPLHAQVSGNAVESGLDHVMQSDTDLAQAFAALKDNFPDQYAGMIKRFAAAVRRGMSPVEARAVGNREMQAFVAGNRRNIAVASTSKLVAYAKAQVNLF